MSKLQNSREKKRSFWNCRWQIWKEGVLGQKTNCFNCLVSHAVLENGMVFLGKESRALCRTIAAAF